MIHTCIQISENPNDVYGYVQIITTKKSETAFLAHCFIPVTRDTECGHHLLHHSPLHCVPIQAFSSLHWNKDCKKMFAT